MDEKAFDLSGLALTSFTPLISSGFYKEACIHLL